MNGRQTTPSPRRVVVFVPPLAGQQPWNVPGAGLDFVPAPSAYEAAAELLAAPAAALVIDLRLWKPSHARLVNLAHRAGAEVIGLGPIPAWVDQKQSNGVRLIERGQLLQTLQGLQPAETSGTYESQMPAPPPAAMSGDEPLLTAEELSALLGNSE